jgi:hypothetical protein
MVSHGATVHRDIPTDQPLGCNCNTHFSHSICWVSFSGIVQCLPTSEAPSSLLLAGLLFGDKSGHALRYCIRLTGPASPPLSPVQTCIPHACIRGLYQSIQASVSLHPHMILLLFSGARGSRFYAGQASLTIMQTHIRVVDSRRASQPFPTPVHTCRLGRRVLGRSRPSMPREKSG